MCSAAARCFSARRAYSPCSSASACDGINVGCESSRMRVRIAWAALMVAREEERPPELWAPCRQFWPAAARHSWSHQALVCCTRAPVGGMLPRGWHRWYVAGGGGGSCCSACCCCCCCSSTRPPSLAFPVPALLLLLVLPLPPLLLLLLLLHMLQEMRHLYRMSSTSLPRLELRGRACRQWATPLQQLLLWTACDVVQGCTGMQGWRQCA